MERPYDSCAEILDRISPALPAVFSAYRIPEERAREIVGDACLTLISKWRLRHQDAEGWLLRTIIERCRRARKETGFEDPSE
ncbi:MAG: hypothetical protein ACJ75H_06455 [Thermoanaerobaculia bacterium]